MAKRRRPKVLGNWDAAQHDPVSNPPNLSRMRKDDAVEAIKDWFLENFEDPAESTPYESAEGGYQYIWGGPYDTRDIVENVFYQKTSLTAVEEARAGRAVVSATALRRKDRCYFAVTVLGSNAHGVLSSRSATLISVFLSSGGTVG